MICDYVGIDADSESIYVCRVECDDDDECGPGEVCDIYVCVGEWEL